MEEMIEMIKNKIAAYENSDCIFDAEIADSWKELLAELEG